MIGVPAVLLLVFCMVVFVPKSVAVKVVALLMVTALLLLNTLYFPYIITDIFECENISFKGSLNAVCQNTSTAFASMYQWGSIIGMMSAIPWTIGTCLYLAILFFTRSKLGRRKCNGN